MKVTAEDRSELELERERSRRGVADSVPEMADGPTVKAVRKALSGTVTDP